MSEELVFNTTDHKPSKTWVPYDCARNSS